MATFTQGTGNEMIPALFALDPSGTMSPEPNGPPDVQPFIPSDPGTAQTHVSNTANKSTPSKTVQGRAAEIRAFSMGIDWFETFHVVPRSFDFGNLLADTSVAIEVFSAFRRTVEEWTLFTNNAGAGVALGSAPALPAATDPLTGYVMTLDVDSVGPAFVDTTLDFLFTGLGTAMTPIMIQRIVLFGSTPEVEFVEELEFRTNVYPLKAGKEKRESTRVYPRQSWDYEYKFDEGTDAQTFENLLFDFHGRSFGVPVYFEGSTIDAAVTATDTSVSVDTTAYRDYRVGGLAVIYASQGVFDVLEITVVGATSLTFSSQILNSYAVGTRIYPLAVCHPPASISGERWPANLRRMQVKFRNTNNVVDLADLTPFSTYKTLLLLDNHNSMLQATVRQSHEMEILRLDGEVGQVSQGSSWDRDKRTHDFTLRAEGMQAIWEMRGMVHALRGRQVPFYVPRSSDDLSVVTDLTSGSLFLDVENVGYQQFVRHRQPKSDIRVNFVDGSTPLLRGVTDSTMLSSTVDRLTMDSTWPSTITVAEISRIEYVEKVRLDTDRLRIRYDASGFRARLEAPLRTLFE